MPDLSQISAFGAGTWSSEHGEFISDTHRRFAEVLNDYNPNLSLLFIPARERKLGDRWPFAIQEQIPGRGPVIIRYLDEASMADPKQILAWLFEGDIRRHRVVDVLDRLDAEAAADQLLKQKKWVEDAEDRQDKIAFYVSGGRDKRHSIQHRKGMKIERG